MRFMKRFQIYQASNYNVTFDPIAIQAHSYRWWRFVAVVEGLVVFNTYRYSVTTAKHQLKVRRLLNELGIKIDMELQLPKGIPAVCTIKDLVQIDDETEADQFLASEARKITNNERSAKRRLEKRQAADAQFKANLDSITMDDIERFRAAKLSLVK